MKYLFFLLWVVLMTSCSDNLQLVPGNYQMTCAYKEEAYIRSKKENKASVGCDVACDHEIYHRSFLSFKEDQTFVMGLDDLLLEGKYEINGPKIILKDKSGTELTLEMKKQSKTCVQFFAVFDEVYSQVIPANERLYFNFVRDETLPIETESKFSYNLNT